jgi:acyl-CoA thioester hydrolase
MSDDLASAARFEETRATLRVAYADTDKMGVVYYGNYLRWFEVARAEYLRVRGKSYRELEEDGIHLPVIEAYSRYREPARYDDELSIAALPHEVGPVRLRFGYRVLRLSDGALLAEGHTVHACTGPGGRPRRVPPELKALLLRPPLEKA